MALITNPYEPCRGKSIYDGLKAWDEFNESDHPRAGESAANGGQFVASGGSSGSPGGGKSGHLEEHPDRESWPEHIKALKIPPAWTEVKVAKDPEADLLAIGKDAKGRAQYVYSDRFAKSQSALKFSRIESLQRDKPLIVAQLAALRHSDDRGKRDHADCANLVMKMGIRPGSDSDTKAKVKAFGATTLEGKHVVEEDGQTFLRFTGKKGVAINLPVEDKSLAGNLRSRAKRAGENGRLFGNVRDSSLLAFVHEDLDHGNIETKDMRTLLAAEEADYLVRKLPAPKNEKEYKKRVLEVAKHVAGKLGNTPSVALQAYIPPWCFAKWRESAAF